MNLITAKVSAKKKTRRTESSKKISKSKSATSNKLLDNSPVQAAPVAPTIPVPQAVAPATIRKFDEDEFKVDVVSVKTKLITHKKDILNKSHEFRASQTDRPQVTEEAEAASIDVNHSLSIHLHERDRSALYMIERALSKIAEGSYGICESCAAQISARRLAATPFTPICIDCAEEQESRLN